MEDSPNPESGSLKTFMRYILSTNPCMATTVMGKVTEGLHAQHTLAWSMNGCELWTSACKLDKLLNLTFTCLNCKSV